MTDRTRTPYLITPVYLAGPDPHATTTVTEVLAAAGWHVRPHAPGVLWAPDARRAARRRTPHPNQPFTEALVVPGQVYGGWEFAAFPAPGQPPMWQARFAPATPPELTAAFAAALADPAPAPDGRPRYLAPPGSPGEATRPLTAAGWICDLGTEATWSPHTGQAAVITPPLDPEHRNEGNWVAAACRITDAVTLWHAQATPHTPTHLITALCRALTDPTPVPRHTLPAPEHRARTVPHPR
ncbi:DUF317 domain-containing protein [Streptomyces sp. NPDC051561]|uniref:DUF317 domain-containing protein n=1 Tax=Streptomyces sp. NPDC051561 TaxID=3365658 RepID=UPI0037BDB712